jgi:hypothetical protein
MPRRLTLEESFEVAYENEREASRWALQSLARHLFLVEEELFRERHARQLAESRAANLERRLFDRGPAPPPASGVQRKAEDVAEDLAAAQEPGKVVVLWKDGTLQKL